MAKDYRFINVTKEGGVGVVRLMRPERLNAMCLEMREELVDFIGGVDKDSEISGIVITGEGERAFSAGADLEELKGRTTESELTRDALLRRELPYLLESIGKPSIAAINGICLGAGLELALACTLRIASDNATFGLPEVNLGVIPGSGGSQRLPRVIGMGRAMWMVATGLTIGVDKAESFGLVTEVMESKRLLDRAIDLARLIGSKGGRAFVAARDLVRDGFNVDLRTGIEMERLWFALCLADGEHKKRVDELLERRQARKG